MTIRSVSTLTLVCLGMMLSACASGGAGHTPIIDAPKTPQYYADLDACRVLASQRKLLNGDTQTAAVVGAAGGALIRGISDRDSFEEVLGGAAIGGALGGGAGALSAYGEQKDILLRCMAGRGYRVLG